MKPGRLQTPIFVYDDAVDYLQEWARYARRFGVTHKDIVAKAGFGAHAFVSDVISRRKKIGHRHIEGFIAALELSGDAADYFRLLAQRDIERNPEKKAALFRRLGELREKHAGKIVADRALEYFASWRYPVIREYILYKKEVHSPKEIIHALEHLKLSTREVEAALIKLQKWNLVYFDTDRKVWRPCSEEGTVSYREMPHAVVNDVKRTLIEASIHAMESLPREKRHVSMAIRGVSEQRYRELCRKIDILRKEFLSLDESDAVDRVVSFNAQVYPLIYIRPDRSEKDRDS